MPYVFGYLSLINSDSVLFSTQDDLGTSVIPARLTGYHRVWTGYRRPDLHSPKHYVHPDTLNNVSCFSWATLVPGPGFVNGVCFEIDGNDLVNIDNREGGYRRTDVTDRIAPYTNFRLKANEAIYTYISDTASLDSFYPPVIPYISADYVNMGFFGALAVNKFADGFYKDFVATTDLVEAAISDIRQVFWSNNGQRLYLLDEKDSSVILLHDFDRSVFPAYAQEDIHFSRKATPALVAYDLRSVTRDRTSRYYHCMHCAAADIPRLLESRDPWVRVYLVKNSAMTKEQRDLLSRSTNFVSQLILAYQDD